MTRGWHCIRCILQILYVSAQYQFLALCALYQMHITKSSSARPYELANHRRFFTLYAFYQITVYIAKQSLLRFNKMWKFQFFFDDTVDIGNLVEKRKMGLFGKLNIKVRLSRSVSFSIIFLRINSFFFKWNFT